MIFTGEILMKMKKKMSRSRCSVTEILLFFSLIAEEILVKENEKDTPSVSIYVAKLEFGELTKFFFVQNFLICI